MLPTLQQTTVMQQPTRLSQVEKLKELLAANQTQKQG